MCQIVKLIQGSPEWHARRAKYRNASETLAVMGLSPWQTPLQLWEQRTGRTQSIVNAAMARGTQLEPLVLVEGDYSASLTGFASSRRRCWTDEAWIYIAMTRLMLERLV